MATGFANASRPSLGKTFMHRIALLLLAATVGLCGAAPSARATTYVDSFAQGWINANGQGNGAYDPNNTFTGISGGLNYNSWAAFYIPDGSYLSAILDVTATNWYAPVAQLIGVFDVGTSFTLYSDSSAGGAGYADLMSGAEYARAPMLNGFVALALSSTAVADINAAAGRIFMVGFTNFSAAAYPDTGIYPNGSSAGSPVLALEIGTPIPSPRADFLLGIGLISLVGVRRVHELSRARRVARAR